MKPIKINENVARTCFKHDGCGLSANEVTIEVSRIGGGSPTIVYPALDISNGKICFAWDSLFYTSKAGRYQGIIKFKGDLCKPICVPLLLEHCDCSVGEATNELFISKECVGCNQ